MIGLTYVSFETVPINWLAFAAICIGVAICVVLNMLFHFIIGKLRGDDKIAIPFYLERYYKDVDDDISNRR